MATPLAFIGMPGIPEMLIIMVVLMLLFGHRLPGVMRSLGRGVVEFKKGINDVGDEFDEAKRAIDSDGSRDDEKNA